MTDFSQLIRPGLLALSGALIGGVPLYIFTIYRYTDLSRQKALAIASVGVVLGLLIFGFGMGQDLVVILCVAGFVGSVVLITFYASLPRKK